MCGCSLPLVFAWFAATVFCVSCTVAVAVNNQQTTETNIKYDGDTCKPDKLTVYKVVFRTFWSRDRFPKHYPDWRPPAQWSRVIGRSHDSSYTLFKFGHLASSGLKTFAETGRTDDIDSHTQRISGVCDEFSAPSISSGVGSTETTFFIDGRHSRVSLISRMIPSPDWFVGLDSFDLCVNGNWIDTITVEADPLDAGTDNGFTFTAPDWPTVPQGTVYRITSNYPSHPAGSFYYPYIKRLPAIATFTFIKVKEYELSQIFSRTDGTSDGGIKGEPVLSVSSSNSNKNGDLEAEIEEERLEQEFLHHTASSLDANSISSTSSPHHNYYYDDSDNYYNSLNDKSAIFNSIVKMYRQNTRHEDKLKLLRKLKSDEEVEEAKVHRRTYIRNPLRRPRDCQVSDWGDWGPCSKICGGIGEMTRRRQVLKHARRGGKLCPPLVQTKWCGSPRPCNATTLPPL